MNKKSFFAGVLVGTIMTFILLFILFLMDEKYHFITYNDPKFKTNDSIFEVPSVIPVINMSEKEFDKEMMKGVQGDYTLEQVDSMQRAWTVLDSIESNKP